MSKKCGFCWSIIAACCEVISMKHVSNLHKFKTIVDQLCGIFDVYCKHYHAGKDCIMITKLPKEIAATHEDIKRYVLLKITNGNQ